ncbi:MAG: phasin family protein [Burkholderiales bacterium]
MLKTPQELTELSRGNLESAMRLAQISMHSAEKLVRLQLEAGRMFVEENSRNAKSLAAAKTPEDMLALRAKFAESSFAKAMEYSRGLYEIAAEAQAEFKQIIEKSLTAYGKESGQASEAAKAFPDGADLVTTTLKATMAASTAAMDSLTQAAKQMTNFAGSTFHPAGSSATSGKEPAKKRRDRSAQ